MDNRQKTLIIALVTTVIVLLIALAGLVAYLFLGQAAPDRLTATLTQTATPAPTATPTLQNISDPVWDRIQTAQKMVVGISADYPPFASVASDFTLQGYDLALVEEISKRMGMPFEIKNLAFDGLTDALTLGQIDMAVSAISITDERDQYVDFTNVYFVSEDAVLAPQASRAVVGQWQDLSQYRVGVQKGSVYEDRVFTTLVESGQMQPQSLVVFDTADQLLQALSGPAQTVDLALMDFLAADAAVRQGELKIAAHNLAPQRYAAAIPQGALVLQARLNAVLADMQADGTLPALAKQYLSISEPPPLPTPAPTSPPAPPKPCLDGMAFVQDLTYPDNNMQSPTRVAPGALFQKGWRIRNVGTCTWTEAYRLAYAGSSPENAALGGNPVVIQGQVPPNGDYDIYVNLVAPIWAGRYQSFWTMQNASGVQFGQRIWAGFDIPVPVGPTPTPMPPAPQIFAFTVDRKEVHQGECVSLDWQYLAQDLVMARLFRDEMVLITDLAFIGSFTDCPANIGSFEYRLVVDTRSGGSARAAQTVEVTVPLLPTPAPQPVIDYFYTDQDAVVAGQCVSLSWSYSGSDLSSTSITVNGDVIRSNLEPSGSLTDCPRSAGTNEYTLQATSASYGTIQQSVYVTVMDPVYPTDTPDIDPPGPVYPTDEPPVDPPDPDTQQ